MMEYKFQFRLACLLLILEPLSAVADCPLTVTQTHDAAAFSITESEEPTVTHRVTGLEWARCSLGQNWNVSGNQCEGSAQTLTWEAALTAAEQETYADKIDWRLPNKKELASLIDFGCHGPAINTDVFPDTSTESAYWTSTPLPPGFSPAAAWMVDFGQGSFTSSARSAALHARLVRGGQ